jgi:hypothetical protein
MNFRIFYAYQTDKYPESNLNFIEKAANEAIKRIDKDPATKYSILLDRDTKDTAGAPDIPDTVLSKIEKCHAFIADVTFVGTTYRPSNNAQNAKPIPNANVMMEVGWAAKSISWNRMILVMNTAYGAVEQLPFDFKHRLCIGYELGPNKGASEVDVLEKLSQDLEEAIRQIMKYGIADSENAGDTQENKKSILIAQKTLGEFHSSLTTGNFFNMQLDDGALAVAVIPLQLASVAIAEIKHEDLLRKHLMPLWCTGWNHSRTGRSFRTFDPQEQNPVTATEFRSDGTIHAANRQIQIAGVRDSFNFRESQNIKVIPLWDIEVVVTKGIISYLILSKALEIQGPWFISISLLNLRPTVVQKRTKNYLLGEARTFLGKDIVPDSVFIQKFTDLSKREDVARCLKSVFDFIWMEFNFRASPHYDGSGKWINE